VRMYIGSDWTDVTGDVLYNQRVHITRGRGDAATVTPPQTCSFGLSNQDLRYAPHNPMSPYYGSLGQNTPIEVFKVLASDSFSRTVTSGWGVADTGQSWNSGLFGSGGSVVLSNWNVTPGAGTMSVPATSAYRAARITSERYRDVDYQHDVSIPLTNVTGGDLEPGNVYLRHDRATDIGYLCRVVITTAEAVTVTFHHTVVGQLAAPVTVAGLTHSSAQTLRIRCQAEGNTLRAKVWAVGTGEPYGWAITVHDTRVVVAGLVGPRNGVAASNTNALPIVFSISNVRVSSMRSSTELSAPKGVSDVSGRVRTASVESAGILRRLGQGDAPQQSVMRRAILGLTARPMAYWPCEDIEGSTGGPSSGLPGGAPMAGDPDYAADDTTFACSAPLPTLPGIGTGLYGVVPTFVSSGANQVRWLMRIPDAGITDGITILRVLMTGGTTGFWDIRYNAGGGLSLIIFDPNGTQIYGAGMAFDVEGKARRYSLELTQDGADIDWAISEVSPEGATGVNGTLAGRTFGRMSEVLLTPGEDTVVGHITVENSVTSAFDLAVQLGAFAGETAVDRLIRLSSENAVPFAYVGTASDSERMGPQRVDTLINLLRECADTDGGSLGESRGVVGLSYRTRASAYAQTPVVAIDCSLTQLRHPFQPVPDDRDTVNDITVKRATGGEFRRTLDVGRMSTLPPPVGVGRYDDTHDANSHTESSAGYLADWLLALGTIDEPRYPALGLTLDSDDTLPLRQAALDVDTDDLIRVVGAGSYIGVFDPIDQLVRGTKETLSNIEHVLLFNTTPATPYAVAVLDAAAAVLDSGTSTLAAGYSSSATTLSVATANAGDLWATAGIFPRVIVVAGETMTVSAISGATSPQTFTVSRSTNGVVKAQLAGAPVHASTPARLAM
jgi:hypothetical protein